MIWRYSDPVLDAEAYFTHAEAATIRWEEEHYRGKCPYCGKPMYEDAEDWKENWDFDEEIDDYAHEACIYWAAKDREEEEEEARAEAETAFTKMMGNPLEALDNLVTT